MATTNEKLIHVANYLAWRQSELLIDPDAELDAAAYLSYLERVKDKALLADIEHIMSQGGYSSVKWEVYDKVKALIAEARA